MLHHLFVILNAEPSRQQASKEDLKPAPDSTAVYVGIQHMDYGAALMQHLPTLGVFQPRGHLSASLLVASPSLLA